MVSKDCSFKSTNSFQLNLLKQMVSCNKDSNSVFSPLSMYLALSLAANGAVGQTQSEILSLLQETSIEEVNSKSSSMMKSECFSSSGRNVLSMANGIFSRATPSKEFQSVSSSVFSSSCEMLKSADQINKWCSERTSGKIDKIISSVSDDMQMLLMNAVYFKGEWMSKFKKSCTSKKSFFNKMNSECSVEMMEQIINTNFSESSSMQMVELCYADSNLSSFIMLPSMNMSIDDLILKMDSSEFSSCFSSMKKSSVQLSMPRFVVESQMSMKSILQCMGMSSCFTSSADFSCMSSERHVQLGDVVHKSFMRVDEEGTEAASTSMAEVSSKKVVTSEVKMNVNRPFLLIVRDKSIDQMLFMAKVENIVSQSSS